MRYLMAATLILFSACGKSDPPAAQAPATPPAGALRPARTVTPMNLAVWTPPSEALLPREILTGEEWTKRWEAVRSKIELKALEAETRPSFGLRIINLVPGFQAEKAGIQLEDQIVAFEGHPAIGVNAFSRLRGRKSGNLDLWSPSRGPYSVQLKGGRMGVVYQAEWSPVSGYLRTKERDPKWDVLVVGAAQQYVKDAALTETALFHAAKAGYDGPMLPALMAFITCENGRPREAMAWALTAVDRISEDQRGVIVSNFIFSACLSGQVEWAIRKSREWADRIPIMSDGWAGGEQLSLLKTFSEGERMEPSPCTKAASGRFPVLDLQSLEWNSNHLLTTLKSHGSSPFDMAPPSNIPMIIGPPGRNVHFLMDLEVRAFTPPLEGSEAAAEFSMVEISEGIEEKLTRIQISPGKSVTVTDREEAYYTLTGNEICKGPSYRVEIAATGRQYEIRLNDRCLYLGAIEDAPGRRLVFRTKLSNVVGTIKSVEATSIDSTPAPEAAVARVAIAKPGELKIPAKPSDPALQWAHQALVEGYLAKGRRNPAWDQDAVDALALFVPLLMDVWHLTEVGDLAVLTGRAIAAGCDDPLVLCASGYALSVTSHREYAASKVLRRGAQALKGSTLSPTLRCLIMARSAKVSQYALMDASQNQANALVESALALLPEALAEDGAPGSVQLDAMSRIAELHPIVKTNPEGGFQKVWQAGVKVEKARAPLLALKGKSYIDLAWEARGSGYANTVTEEGWKLFRHRLQVAVEALEESWKLDPKNPAVPALMLSAALGNEAVRKDVRVWFERALAASPSNREAASKLLWMLQPRWFGSKPELVAAGKELFERAKRDNLDPSMAVALIEALKLVVDDLVPSDASAADTQAITEEYWRSQEVWLLVRDVYDWILLKHPESSYYRSLYAAVAGRAGKWPLAKKQFEQLGDRLIPAAFSSYIEMEMLRARAFESK